MLGTGTARGRCDGYLSRHREADVGCRRVAVGGVVIGVVRLSVGVWLLVVCVLCTVYVAACCVAVCGGVAPWRVRGCLVCAFRPTMRSRLMTQTPCRRHTPTNACVVMDTRTQHTAAVPTGQPRQTEVPALTATHGCKGGGVIRSGGRCLGQCRPHTHGRGVDFWGC